MSYARCAHDRRVPVTLDMLCKGNAGKDVKVDKADWVEPKEVRHIQEAVLNYTVLLNAIWPLDYAGLVITRILVELSWGAVAGSLRYFADRFGVPRAGIEGTQLSIELIKQYAQRHPPELALEPGARGFWFGARASLCVFCVVGLFVVSLSLIGVSLFLLCFYCS